MRRRALLAIVALPGFARAQSPDDDAIRPDRALRWPRDHGAHPGARNEWWYATGWLGDDAAPIGFQVTFFRHRTGLAEALPGRFAPRQLLFAHAALSDIAAGTHLQAQRTMRWSGDEHDAAVHARRNDTDVRIGRWWLQRDAAAATDRYRAQVGGADAPFALQIELAATQPLLLQG
ncbi:MAG TPA: carotenoid 1,2-hydratase, partial [Burkholderiaceae bacterium]|nr:carotenoid 1,2-hydratase [Burkholderiaceae bacterium]